MTSLYRHCSISLLHLYYILYSTCSSTDPYSPPLGVITHNLVAVIQLFYLICICLSRCYQYLASLHDLQAAMPPKGRKHPTNLSGKWRLITDLLFLKGVSISDGIDSCFCSIQYMSVDKIAKVAHSLGARTLRAKLDVQVAYRLVPVHPDDRSLMFFNCGGCSTLMACCYSASA